MQWFSTSGPSLVLIAISTIAVFFILILLTRLAGIRSFSKMSGFDFAVTVAIGSILASVIIAKDPPLANGLAALVSLFAIQIGFATLRHRFEFLRNLADNAPRLIMIGDRIQHDQLKKAKMTESDLMAKLREANVLNFSQVAAVIAETTGDVSVLHSDKDDAKLQQQIFDGVIGADRLKMDKSI